MQNANLRSALNATATLTVAIAFACAYVAAAATPDLFVLNQSKSMPRGLYVRDFSDHALSAGDIVTVRARDVSPNYAHARRFTDENDRFIKRVAAVDGDVVCASGGLVRINGSIVAERQRRDSLGRLLPRWRGCRTLDGQALLLGESIDSFDGRYWGPVERGQIEGRWRLMAIYPARAPLTYFDARSATRN